MPRLAAIVALTSLVTAQKQWPQFLGTGARATAKSAISLRFDLAKDLRYRVAIPTGVSSPCIWGEQIFLTGMDGDELVMFAVDRNTGAEQWRHAVPAPEGSDFKHKDGGNGNITKTHVEWTVRRGIPYVASPLFHKGRLYLLKAGGVIGAYDAMTGKQVVKRGRLEDHSEYYATPIAIGDHVIACSSAGTLFVLDPNNKLATVRSVDFHEPIFATPAVVDGVVYVRTRAALYAFGK